MSNGPRIIASAPGEHGFRLVRLEDGNLVSHVLEVPDGCDALGVEKWREFKMNSPHLVTLFGFFIKLVTQEKP